MELDDMKGCKYKGKYNSEIVKIVEKSTLYLLYHTFQF